MDKAGAPAECLYLSLSLSLSLSWSCVSFSDLYISVFLNCVVLPSPQPCTNCCTLSPLFLSRRIPDIFDMNGPPHSSLGSLGSLGSISIPSLPSFSSNTSSMQHHHHDIGGSLTMHDGGMGSGPGSHPHSGGFQTNGGMDSGQNGYEQQMGVMRSEFS